MSIATCGRRSSSTCCPTPSSSPSRAGSPVSLRHAATASALTVRDTGVGIPGARAAAPVRALPPHRGRAGPHASKAAASGWRWCRNWCGCTAARSRRTARYGKGTAFTVTIPFGTAHCRRTGSVERARCLHRGPRRGLRRGGLALAARRSEPPARDRCVADADADESRRWRRRPRVSAGRRQRRHARLRAPAAGATLRRRRRCRTGRRRWHAIAPRPARSGAVAT